MRRSRIAWVLVCLAASSVGAWATRLDKSACRDLKSELAAMVAAGVRDDMQRGPEWAKANLTPERLGNIQHLIGIEEQLEFRCGMRRSRIAATLPSKKARHRVPEKPMKKPAHNSSAESKTPAPVASAKPSQAAEKPAPQKAPIAGSKPAAAPKTASAARDGSSRRESSAAYVSPADVNPFFVTRYGDTQ